MKKYFKMTIIIIFLMCPLFHAAAAENVEIEYFEADDGGVEVSGCIIWGVVVGIAGATLFTMIEVKKHKPVAKATHADYYIKDGDAKMSVTEDKYLRSAEVKTKVENSNSKNKK